MKSFVTSFALIAMLTPVVAAQEDNSFSGFYIGAEIGSNWQKSLTKHELYNDTNQNQSSFQYGGIVGYRFDFMDNILLGFEGTYGQNNDDLALTPKDGLIFPQVVGADGPHAGTFQPTNEWSISGTLGTVFGSSNKHYIYGSAGFAKDSHKFEADSRTDLNHKYSYNGLRLGAGYEYALTNNISLRASAKFTAYNEGKLSEGPTQLLYLGLRDNHKWQTSLGVLYNF